MSKPTYRCECPYDHPHKRINARDFDKLWKHPDYDNDGVFVRRANCPRNNEGKTKILATSGKLVLVKVLYYYDDPKDDFEDDFSD